MHRTLLKPFGRIMLALAVALSLSGCSKNKQQQGEIDSLRQEIRDREATLEATLTQCQELAQKNSELSAKASEAEQKASYAQSQLDQVKSDLESLRSAKTNEATLTSNQTPAEALEAAKSQLDKQLGAVLLIEGDVTSGRGAVIQADGKTWLYSSAPVFSGNTKFTIKGPDGTALTKLGALQVAADANLARLEILQEMPVKLDLDSAATVDATTKLLAAGAGPNNTAPQMIECQAARTTGNDLELESSNIAQSTGCPLFNAQSGKVIGILSAGSAAVPPSLWPVPQQASADATNTRAARLNRTITWKPITVAAFLAERRKIDDMNKTTRLLHALAGVRVSGDTLQLAGPLGGATTVLKELEQNAALPMVAELMKLNSALTDTKTRVAARDITRRLSSILSQANSASTRQVQDMKTIVFSFCHRSAAELALKWRAEADQALNASLDKFGR